MAFCKKDRAHGEDAIPDEAIALAPTESADMYQPLLLKASLRCEEPLAYRGGNVVDIWKGKASPFDCSNSRGVTIGDSVSKKYHMWLRKCLFPYAHKFSDRTQCGGYKQRGTDVCSFVVRSFMQSVVPMRWSCAVLFVDIVAAFDSLIRPQLFKCYGDNANGMDVLRTLNMPADIVQLALDCCIDSILSQANVPPHLEALISNSHQCSWFSTDCVFDIVRSTKGSKAGDALGERYHFQHVRFSYRP